LTPRKSHNPFRTMNLPVKPYKNRTSRKWDLRDRDGVIVASDMTKSDVEIVCKVLNYIEKTIPYLTGLLSNFVTTENIMTPIVSAGIEEVKEREILVDETAGFLMSIGIIEPPVINYEQNVKDWGESLFNRNEEVPQWTQQYYKMKKEGFHQ